MPTKPTTSYDWDTNQTNTAQPTAGLRSDGYATDDIPASTHFNYILNSLGLWVEYFEDVTDALDTLSSVTDITLNIDTDNDSTTNRLLLTHDGSTELLSVDESANIRLNQATVGTNGTGTIAIKEGVAPTTTVTDVVQLYTDEYAPGDDRLYVQGEAGDPVIIGNGAVEATGNITAANITATNATDIATNTSDIAASKAKYLISAVETMGAMPSGASNWFKIHAAYSPTVNASGGNGTWVVVGHSGAGVTYSLRWAAQGGAVANEQTSFGPNTAGFSPAVSWDPVNSLYIIAMGNNATTGVATSPTGVTWTSRALTGTESYEDIYTNASGVSVLVGTSSKIGYSTNGTTWSAGTAANAGTTCVVYGSGPGLWVAAGGSSPALIQTASDPSSTWTARTSGSNSTVYCITYSSTLGMYLIGTSGGGIIRSTDGINWTFDDAVLPLSACHSIAASPYGIVAMERTTNPRACVSLDGLTWSNAFYVQSNAPATAMVNGTASRIVYSGSTTSPRYIITSASDSTPVGAISASVSQTS